MLHEHSDNKVPCLVGLGSSEQELSIEDKLGLPCTSIDKSLSMHNLGLNLPAFIQKQKHEKLQMHGKVHL